MENSSSSKTNSSMPSQKRSHGIVLNLAMCLVVVIAAIAGVYFWQHQKVTNAETQNKALSALLMATRTQNQELQMQVTDAKKDAAAKTDDTKPMTADELVTAAVKNYCNAMVDAKKQPLVLTMGTSKGKAVLYSADKNFAYVNAACVGKGESTDGESQAYYLKKVNDTWIVLYRGQAASDTYTTLFNIPTTFN
jgi:uncharacterized protein HemX